MADVAEALVTALNLQTWPMEAEAARGWVPVQTPEDTEDPAITVVPTGMATSNAARGKKRIVVSLSIVVQRQSGAVSGEGDAVLRDDEIAELAQAVEDWVSDRGNAITTSEGLRAGSVGDTAQEVDQERLAQAIMAIQITATYELWRDAGG